MKKRIHGFAVSNIGSERTVESCSLPKKTKQEKFVYVFDDSEEFSDPALLTYSNHELTDEQLAKITNHFYK